MKQWIDFFSHETYAQENPKLKMLLLEHGWEWYGRFWGLNEIIASMDRCTLDISQKYNLLSVAKKLDLNPWELDTFLIYLKDECELLYEIEGKITTACVQESYQLVKKERDRKAGKRSKSVGPPSPQAPLRENTGNPKDGQKRWAPMQAAPRASPWNIHGNSAEAPWHSRGEKRREEERREKDTTAYESTAHPSGGSQPHTETEELSPYHGKIQTKAFFAAYRKGNLYASEFQSRIQALRDAGLNMDTDDIKRELIKFANYWTQVGENDVKMLWQKQSAFQVENRFRTWLSNRWSISKPTNAAMPLNSFKKSWVCELWDND